MADTKITAMTDAGPLTGTELIPIVKGGINYRTTPSAITALVPAPPSTTALTNQQIGVGNASNLLSGSAALIYDGIGVGIKSFNSTYRFKIGSIETLTHDAQLYVKLFDTDRLLEMGGNISTVGVLQTDKPFSVIGGQNNGTALILRPTGPGTSDVFVPLTGTLLADPTTAVGDLIVRNSIAAFSVPTRLPAGATAGQVLTSNGAGVAPSYQALPAAATQVPALSQFSVGYGDATNKLTGDATLQFQGDQFFLNKSWANPLMIYVTNTGTGAASSAQLSASNSAASNITLSKASAAAVATGLLAANQGALANSSSSLLIWNSLSTGSNDFIFAVGGTNLNNERFRIYDVNAIGIRSQGAGAYNLKIMNTETLSADRGLTIGVGNGNRTLALGGDFTLAGNLTLSVAAPTSVSIAATSGILTVGGMRYLGAYNAGTNYVLNDVVDFGGAMYLAPGPLVGQTPPTGWTQLSKPARPALTDAATITWDVAAAPVAFVMIAGNRTVAAPTNVVIGATYVLQINQDGNRK